VHTHAPTPDERRPRPIRRAFATVGAAITAVGTAANALISIGALQLADGTAAEDVIVALPGVLQLAVFAAAVAGVITRAEAETTPTADPATVVNGRLVALVRDPAQLRAALQGDR